MQEKSCSTCGDKKPLIEFYPSKDGKYGRTAYCKECGKGKQRDHYKTNKERILKDQKSHIQINRARIRQFIIDYLQTHPCIDCGEKDPVVLEFDHENGGKISAISTMVYQKVSMEKVVQEITKCVVRCANCHRRKTAKERGWHWYASHQ